MEKKDLLKRFVKIGVVLIIIVIFGLVFASVFYESSKEKVLNTLGEISDKSVQVMQKEVEKGKKALSDLAALIGESGTLDLDSEIQKLKAVDHQNEFKRMGLILEDGTAYTTDDFQFSAQDRDYFQRSMKGEVCISDKLTDKKGGGSISVYSVPVVFQDGTRCVLFATYDVEYYRTALSSSIFGGEGLSYVTKTDGSIQIRPKNKGSILDDEENAFWAMGLFVENQSAVEKARTDMKEHEKGMVVYQGYTKNYMCYQPLEINDWYLLTVIPYTVVQSNIAGMLELAYAFTVICVAIIIILILNITRIQVTHQRMLENIAFVDKITGGSTVDKFALDVRERIARYPSVHFAMVYLNIQNFGYINDLYGYGEGDRLLKRVSQELQNHVTEKETFTRIQADHFALLMEMKSREELQKRVEYLCVQEEKYSELFENPYEIKINAGIYPVEDPAIQLDLMIDRAAIAMRKQKNVFEKCLFYDDAMRNEQIQMKKLEDHFVHALEREEFEIYYQARYDIKEDKFYGAEALSRWNCEELGMISPGVFIPLFEKDGNIVRLDEYIFEAVCRQIRSWQDQGLHPGPVSVNISRLHLYRQDFVEKYLKIIEKCGISPEMIQLELTETALFENVSELADTLNRLRKAGILILMDDFGSGYSSVMMLKNIPIDILKIDKSLVDDFEKNDKGRHILEGVIRMCKEIGIQTTAEGVETKEQFEILKNMGCDHIQGYYFVRPVPVKEYEKLFQKSL